jgi:deoxyribodipyrimidine photo-lyase
MAAFLFHRSLRLDDNLGLLKAISEEKKVFPIFCVDPRQVLPKKNIYFSPFCLGFMLQSLQDLQTQLRKHNSDLLLLYGEPHKELPKLFKKKKLKTLYMNYDYTPFARKRAEELKKVLSNVIEVEDYLLYSPESIKTKSGTAFRVFTSFFNSTKKKKVLQPKSFTKKNIASKKEVQSLQNNEAWTILQKYSSFSLLYAPIENPGGRKEALRRLHSLPQTQKHYDKCRNYLTYKTSHLSAYIKFGCVSIREVWEGFGKVSGNAGEELKRGLIWREFYYHYYIAYPEELEWNKIPRNIVLQKKAYPVVKACFQQLNETGYLPNRGRLILGNYILKNQKEYWKNGDLLFAKRLVDYDPFVNIGNWRWIEKQPVFRSLKSKIQYKKWDQHCNLNIEKNEKNKKNKGTYTSFWLRRKE